MVEATITSASPFFSRELGRFHGRELNRAPADSIIGRQRLMDKAIDHPAAARIRNSDLIDQAYGLGMQTEGRRHSPPARLTLIY